MALNYWRTPGCAPLVYVLPVCTLIDSSRIRLKCWIRSGVTVTCVIAYAFDTRFFSVKPFSIHDRIERNGNCVQSTVRDRRIAANPVVPPWKIVWPTRDPSDCSESISNVNCRLRARHTEVRQEISTKPRPTRWSVLSGMTICRSTRIVVRRWHKRVAIARVRKESY